MWHRALGHVEGDERAEKTVALLEQRLSRHHGHLQSQHAANVVVPRAADPNHFVVQIPHDSFKGARIGVGDLVILIVLSPVHIERNGLTLSNLVAACALLLMSGHASTCVILEACVAPSSILILGAVRARIPWPIPIGEAPLNRNRVIVGNRCVHNHVRYSERSSSGQSDFDPFPAVSRIDSKRNKRLRACVDFMERNLRGHG
mmetsp:Transcript_37707/g.82526  ORF Transcript_37707/g.82526 Transcript_37707/m.82526 type:complete len:203 (-) Transcript_37707:49-657(-)